MNEIVTFYPDDTLPGYVRTTDVDAMRRAGYGNRIGVRGEAYICPIVAAEQLRGECRGVTIILALADEAIAGGETPTGGLFQ